MSCCRGSGSDCAGLGPAERRAAGLQVRRPAIGTRCSLASRLKRIPHASVLRRASTQLTRCPHPLASPTPAAGGTAARCAAWQPTRPCWLRAAATTRSVCGVPAAPGMAAAPGAPAEACHLIWRGSERCWRATPARWPACNSLQHCWSAAAGTARCDCGTGALWSAWAWCTRVRPWTGGCCYGGGCTATRTCANSPASAHRCLTRPASLPPPLLQMTGCHPW